MGRFLATRGPDTAVPVLLERAESTYFYGGGLHAEMDRAVVWLTGSSAAHVEILPAAASVGGQIESQTDICGPLSGVPVVDAIRPGDAVLVVPNLTRRFRPLISACYGHVFGQGFLGGRSVYVDPCPELIDLDQPLSKPYFDVRDFFCASVPIVLFLRSVFRESMAQPIERGACVIVDDPYLKSRYGHFTFSEILSLSLKHQFTCTIAFIPWNWRRSRGSVVSLFRRYPDRLSLAIHGCDHSGSEFGDVSVETLNSLTQVSLRRMEQHRLRTELPYDRLMVFPQGVYSTAALAVLKRKGFVAAVNTDAWPIDQPGSIKIRDSWKTANMRHEDFAVFSRRYAFHGLLNFAFDLLLGKPCLIASHHDDYQYSGRDMVALIDQLNGLAVNLNWRSLGGVIRHAGCLHQALNGQQHISMFGNEIVVTNHRGESQRALVEKQEQQPELIQRIEFDGHPVKFTASEGLVRIEVNVAAHHSGCVAVLYKDEYGAAVDGRTLMRRSRAWVRRGLSDVRDEVGARAPWVVTYAKEAGATLRSRIQRART